MRLANNERRTPRLQVGSSVNTHSKRGSSRMKLCMRGFVLLWTVAALGQSIDARVTDVSKLLQERRLKPEFIRAFILASDEGEQQSTEKLARHIIEVSKDQDSVNALVELWNQTQELQRQLSGDAVKNEQDRQRMLAN